MIARILLGLSIAALAAPATAAGPASPLLGTWSLDVATLPVPAAQKPKSVTFIVADAGNGQWTMDVNIVDAGGGVRHSRSTVPIDGTPAKVTASDETDLVAVKLAAPTTLIMALSMGGQPTSTRVYSVSPDGQSETETMVTFTPDGTPTMRTVTFLKARP